MRKEPDYTGTKRCSKCKLILPKKDPITGEPNFSRRSASKDGLTYTCRKCEKEAAKRSYEMRKRKKIVQKKQAEYYQKNKEEHKARVRRNYEENKDYYRERHRKYRLENPEVGRQANKRRRDALAEAEYDGWLRHEIIARDTVDGEVICQICMKPIEDLTELQIDHIVPIIEGGSNTRDNVRCAHKRCNLTRPKDGSDLKGVGNIDKEQGGKNG